MRPFVPRFLAAAGLALVVAFVTAPLARAAATHVVISEFATRGPSAATDEFVELYNPTSAPISIAGWKLQYKSATGTVWNDRATLPANTTIAAHGFYLIANQTYVGTVTPDFTSGSWGSGTGMADNGNIRILDAGALEVDKIGWGTGNDPEGGVDAPNHGTSANNNSVERKALAGSTADSLAAGGLHELLGNGQDTDVNGSDFVVQTHGRNPQNALNLPEPAIAVGGSGTGHAVASPATAFVGQTLGSVALAFSQDSSYTITNIAVTIPSGWTWSHSLADVALSGAAFATATPSVVGDTVFVTGAALTTVDAGTLTISTITPPSSKGSSFLSTRTATATGTLTSIAPVPAVRVLELVPIVSLHVNDATGVATSPYAVGAEATVTGIVTANLSSVRTDVYLQDVSGAIDLFNAALAPVTLAPGDSVTVTGSILQFRGLTELQPDFSLMTVHSSGHPVPDPLVMTCAELNATFHADGTEPNESRLIRINGVTYNSVASTITDASGTANIFIPATYPAVPAVFDIIGILKQFKPGTPAPGPPYTADYEITPRTPDDIIAHPGPVITAGPSEDQIAATSVRLNWTTDVASTSIVHFGTTPALGDSTVDLTAVTTHALTVTGLLPATVYYYSVGSEDVNGRNFSPTGVFSTASPPAASGAIHAYFNKSVNTSVAFPVAANGNADLTAILAGRIATAQRSVDAAIYNLSGTPGTTLANALIAAKNRGVAVRIVCEYDNSTASGFTALQSAGIPLITDRFDPINNGTGLMHDKFFVIDAHGGAPESVWVWTGSWNPTDPGTNNDLQNAIEFQDPALANVYTMEFDEMWGSHTSVPNSGASRFGQRKLDDTPHHFAIGGHPVEAYFSPSDGTTSHIISTINAAQHSIGFQQLTITRSDIAAALIAKHTGGTAVRGDMDSDSDAGSEYANLVGAGVDVKLKTGYSGLLHHKYLIVDADNPHWDGTVLTGSHNWSAAAENSNNENTVIVHDPLTANAYLQEFTARYYQFGGTDSVHVTDAPTNGLPRTLELSQNFPNPFRLSTRIAYALPSATRVTLRLYDVQGRQVRTLVDGVQPAGRHSVMLEPQGLAAGVYLARLDAAGHTQQRKLLYLK